MKRFLLILFTVLASACAPDEINKYYGTSEGCCTTCSTGGASSEASTDALADATDARAEAALDAHYDAHDAADGDALVDAYLDALFEAAPDSPEDAAIDVRDGEVDAYLDALFEGAVPDALAEAEAAVDPCADGLKNGDETDVDCGGLLCAGCNPGYFCATTDDCAEVTVPESGNTPEATFQPRCTPGYGARICNPILHVVVVVQENRSADHYFGVYKNCHEINDGILDDTCFDGLPVDGDGVPTQQFWDPVPGVWAHPWHDASLTVSVGGGHTDKNFGRQFRCANLEDPASCAMDGHADDDAIQHGVVATWTVSDFSNTTPVVVTTSVAHGWTTGATVFMDGAKVTTTPPSSGAPAAFANRTWRITVTGTTTFTLDGSVASGTRKSGGLVRKLNWCQKPGAGCGGDVLAYHTRDELPTYWSLADNYVLASNMHAAINAPSGPQHGVILSGITLTAGCNTWSGGSGTGLVPCKVDVSQYTGTAWPMTSLPYLLREAGVSYAYYLGSDPAPTHCSTTPSGERECPQASPNPGGVQDVWDTPARLLTEQAYLSARVHYDAYFVATNPPNHLPTISWLIPGINYSEHGGDTIRDGQRHIGGVHNALAHSLDWHTTALVVVHDESGGYLDHVPPLALRTLDGILYGSGPRVPCLIISAWSRRAGWIDRGRYTTDSILKLQQDVSLDGQELPGSREDFRPYIGTSDVFLDDMLRADGPFDFKSPPKPPAYPPMP